MSLREGRNNNRTSFHPFAKELLFSQKFQEQFQGLRSFCCLSQSLLDVMCCLQSAAALRDERKRVFWLWQWRQRTEEPKMVVVKVQQVTWKNRRLQKQSWCIQACVCTCPLPAGMLTGSSSSSFPFSISTPVMSNSTTCFLTAAVHESAVLCHRNAAEDKKKCCARYLGH